MLIEGQPRNQELRNVDEVTYYAATERSLRTRHERERAIG